MLQKIKRAAREVFTSPVGKAAARSFVVGATVVLMSSCAGQSSIMQTESIKTGSNSSSFVLDGLDQDLIDSMAPLTKGTPVAMMYASDYSDMVSSFRKAYFKAPRFKLFNRMVTWPWVSSKIENDLEDNIIASSQKIFSDPKLKDKFNKAIRSRSLNDWQEKFIGMTGEGIKKNEISFSMEQVVSVKEGRYVQDAGIMIVPDDYKNSDVTSVFKKVYDETFSMTGLSDGVSFETKALSISQHIAHEFVHAEPGTHNAIMDPSFALGSQIRKAEFRADKISFAHVSSYSGTNEFIKINLSQRVMATALARDYLHANECKLNVQFGNLFPLMAKTKSVSDKDLHSIVIGQSKVKNRRNFFSPSVGSKLTLMERFDAAIKVMPKKEITFKEKLAAASKELMSAYKAGQIKHPISLKIVQNYIEVLGYIKGLVDKGKAKRSTSLQRPNRADGKTNGADSNNGPT